MYTLIRVYATCCLARSPRRDLVGVLPEDVSSSIGREQVLAGTVGVKFSDAASGAARALFSWERPQRCVRRVLLLCLGRQSLRDKNRHHVGNGSIARYVRARIRSDGILTFRDRAVSRLRRIFARLCSAFARAPTDCALYFSCCNSCACEQGVDGVCNYDVKRECGAGGARRAVRMSVYAP